MSISNAYRYRFYRFKTTLFCFFSLLNANNKMRDVLIFLLLAVETIHVGSQMNSNQLKTSCQNIVAIHVSLEKYNSSI